MESTFFDRWLTSVKVLALPFALFCMYSATILHDVYQGHVMKTQARDDTLAACVPVHGLNTCEAELEENHERCSQLAYTPGGRGMSRSFDQNFYGSCAFSDLTQQE